MKKKLLWGAVVMAVAAGVLVLVGGRGKSEPKYQTVKVERGTLTQNVTASGFLSAVTTVAVGSQVSGIIASLHADFNSKVNKGDLLAELDPTPFQARVAQNQANLEKAQVERRNADIALRRQKALSEQGLSPQADVDAMQANYDSARASVAQAEAALQQARTDLQYTKIVAPIDGVVVARQYDVGQTVAASFQAPTLFTIAQDLTKMQVAADVSESDIGKVQTGQPVRFTVDAYPERDFRGRISQIRLNATVNQNVVTYPVIVEVSNADLTLRPNMTANVSISVATVRDALRVPNAALRFKPEVTEQASVEERAARSTSESGTAAMARQVDQSRGGSAGRSRTAAQRPQTIYLLKEPNGDPSSVAVRTGISDGRFTQVVQGDLKEGDNVVTGLVTSRSDFAGATAAPGMGGQGRGGRRGF
jgi:HlyD family secretion protein